MAEIEDEFTTEEDLQALRGGQTHLSLNDLEKILRDGEVLLAFKIHNHENASIATLMVKRQGRLTSAAIPLPRASWHVTNAAVQNLMRTVQQRQPIGAALRSLDEILGLKAIAQLMDDAGQVFVSFDGPLLRLPSHMLPIGQRMLGEIAPSSSIGSIWGFASQRLITGDRERSSLLYAIGDPILFPDNCSLDADEELFGPAPNAIHREVRCLGEPPGTGLLIDELRERFHSLKPIRRDEARVGKVLSEGTGEAGIAVFATHGVMADGSELPFLDEPALVLTPDLNKPE